MVLRIARQPPQPIAAMLTSVRGDRVAGEELGGDAGLGDLVELGARIEVDHGAFRQPSFERQDGGERRRRALGQIGAVE